MKILYFNYLYDRFGISIGSTIKAIELMNALIGLGHDVEIIWRKDELTEKSFISHSRFWLKKRLAKYLHFPNQLLSNARYLIQEYRLIKRYQPDLLIFRLDECLFSPLVLSKLLRIPQILEIDSPVSYEIEKFHKGYAIPFSLYRLMDRFNIYFSTACFTVSEELRRHYCWQITDPDRITVITNGADIIKFHPQIDPFSLKNKYCLTNRLVVGFIGSFHYWHGIENLILLIENLLSTYDNVCFLFVGGGGPMEDDLRKYIQENRIEEKVVFTGHVAHDEIPQYVAAMDMVLAPYPKLDFFYYSPVKIFEYMACAKPVVTSRIGQIGDVIVHGWNGLLCEPDNIQQYTDRLSDLIRSSTLREKIGQNARKTIVENFTWKKKAQELSNLCECVIVQHTNNRFT